MVAEITEKLKNAASGVLVDYKGINVAEDTALRREFREAGVDYAVVKNTLLRFAMNDVGYGEFDPLLNGTTSIALSATDSIAPARIVNNYAKKLNGKFEIKGGFVEGRIMSVEELTALAAIPSKQALLAQVLGTMLAPITSLAVVLGQILEKKNGGEAISSETAEADAAPVEAAPAEETAAGEAAPVETEAAPEAEETAEETSEE
jgi:large subunit ribosomal protein L10